MKTMYATSYLTGDEIGPMDVTDDTSAGDQQGYVLHDTWADAQDWVILRLRRELFLAEAIVPARKSKLEYAIKLKEEKDDDGKDTEATL